MPLLHHNPRWLPRALAAVGLPAGLFLICLGLGFTPQWLQKILLPAQGWSPVFGLYSVAGVALAWSVISYWASRDKHRLLLVLKPDTTAGRLTRRLLLLSLILPPVGGMMENMTLAAGFPVQMHMGLFSLIQLLLLGGIVLYFGFVLRSSERERDRAETERAMALRQLERQASILQSEVARRTTELCQALDYNKRLALVAAHTTDAIIVTNAEGLIQWVNEGFVRLSGYAAEEVVNQKPGSFLQGPMTDPSTAAYMRERLSAHQAFSVEIINYSKGGVPYWAELKVQPMRDPAGVVTGFMGTASDITARKSAEERTNAAKEEAEQLNIQLEQVIAQAQQSATEANIASQAKSSFLATMSHEIRTPLNGVIGMAGLLRDTGLDERQLEFVRTIETSGDALLSIINDVLDYSKIEAGRIELENEPFDLRQCIEDALDLFAAKATEKNLELISRIGVDVPGIILGDVTRLRQIVVNLVSNALKFTAKGEVVVTIESAAAGLDGAQVLTMGVRDSGIGIPADRMDRLFQPFSQVDSSTTRKYGGSGLGLVICRKLAEAMGGIMWVVSEAGQGSTFSFTIKTRAEVATTPARWQTAAGMFAGKNILVVDDNAAVRAWLTEQLSAWGAQVTAADSGAAALAYLQGPESCDLALFDRAMPGMDGLKLAEAVKAIPARASLRLILLSSLTNNATPPGFANLVSKPMKPAPLFTAIDRTIGNGLAVEAAAQVAMFSRSAKVQVPLSSVRLLLVEDNSVNLRVATMLLSKLGFKARVANNGEEALAVFKEEVFDVILMDMEMPVLDGCEATRRIRETATATRPWIIALTANAMSADRNRAFAAGMNDFVTKPIRLTELSTALQRAAENIKDAVPETADAAGAV
jgi:PAS domain S-box-containing protein